MKQLTFIFAAICFLAYAKPVSAQFLDRPSDNPVANDNNTDDMYRTPRIGIGFTTNNAYDDALGTANRARLAVRDGILAHHVSGEIGTFAGKWCGLGIGNPGGSVQPYGLAIADTGSVGFYNIIREVFEGATRKNTVAGFGAEGPISTALSYAPTPVRMQPPARIFSLPTPTARWASTPSPRPLSG